MDVGEICLCFPCIISYLDGYVWPREEYQVYPQLQQKGFTLAQQRAVAEEWYWVAVERESAVNDYLQGFVSFLDGCWWRRPPSPPKQRYCHGVPCTPLFALVDPVPSIPAYSMPLAKS